jgi:hypothetical protein
MSQLLVAMAGDIYMGQGTSIYTKLNFLFCFVEFEFQIKCEAIGKNIHLRMDHTYTQDDIIKLITTSKMARLFWTKTVDDAPYTFAIGHRKVRFVLPHMLSCLRDAFFVVSDEGGYPTTHWYKFSCVSFS